MFRTSLHEMYGVPKTKIPITKTGTQPYLSDQGGGQAVKSIRNCCLLRTSTAVADQHLPHARTAGAKPRNLIMVVGVEAGRETSTATRLLTGSYPRVPPSAIPRPPREESKQHPSQQRLLRQRSEGPAGAPGKRRGFPPWGFSRWGEFFYVFRVARVGSRKAYAACSHFVYGVHWNTPYAFLFSRTTVGEMVLAQRCSRLYHASGMLSGVRQNNTIAAVTYCHVDGRGLWKRLYTSCFGGVRYSEFSCPKLRLSTFGRRVSLQA